MATIRRVRTVFEGVAGAPYYHSLYWPFVVSTEDAVSQTSDFWDVCNGVMDASCTYNTDGVVVNIDATSGEPIGADVVDGIPGAGQVSGEILSTALQVLISTRTGVYVGGREIRGRTFVPALPVALTVDGVVDPGTVTGLSDDLATWLGGLADPPVCWSRAHGQAATISAMTVWGQFAVLRSRRD